MNTDKQFCLLMNQGHYEFALRADSSQSEGIKIGSGRYSLIVKDESQRAAIERIIKNVLQSHPQSLKEFSAKLKGTDSWTKKDKHDKKEVDKKYWDKFKDQPRDSLNFMVYLKNTAKYDLSIKQEVIEGLLTAKNEEEFIAHFLNLPMSSVYKVDACDDINATLQPAIDPEQKLTHEKIEELKGYLKKSGFSGVVNLSDRSKTHCLASSNISDPRIPFAIHSVGKVMTQSLIFMMIQKGVISEKILHEPIQLDPEVEEKLPKKVKEFLKGPDAPTLHQIMSHKGKLGDYLKNYADRIETGSIPQIQSVEDFLEFADDTIKENNYSNLGILLVGLSLQHLCKKEYHEILEENVILPAKIKTFSEKRPEIACYNKLDPVGKEFVGGPAGGYWMSGKDLLKFGRWLGDKYRKDPEFRELVQSYGKEFYNAECIAHNGGIDSSSAFLSCFLESGITLAIVSDLPDTAAWINEKIRQHLL